MNTSATPLIALDAVSLDTETTGLDARSARIVEIAVLRVHGVEAGACPILEQLVDPGIPIPAASSKIHGLTQSLLDGAPPFASVAPLIETAIGSSVVIGHNIGYDLAILESEHQRLGLRWTPPRSLDVRALARIAAPDLASYSLDALCQWQDIPIQERHRALPDAAATAQVFVRLIPLLRASGIRTLAEAERAQRNLSGEARLHQLEGWVATPEAPRQRASRAMAAVDSYPFRHRVRDLDIKAPVFLAPDTPLGEAAALLTKTHTATFALVGEARQVAGAIGTDGLLAALIAPEPGKTAVGHLALWPVHAIGEDEFIYRALGRMRRLEAEHLAVTDRQGAIIGTLSAASLLDHRASQALALGDDIEAAEDVQALARAWARLPHVVTASLEEGIAAPQIAGIISAEICALTAKAARIAEARMRAAGHGDAPCPYAVLVLGSAGRGDSLLSADQDNAIVYAEGAPGGAADLWFAQAATHMADILNEVGIIYCPGGVMAKNPGCRHSREIWKTVIGDWVHHARPEDALASDIFFDAVPVHGDFALAEEVIAGGFAEAERSAAFLAALAAFAKDWLPPIGLLGRIGVDGDGRLDLKRNGLHPVVTSARTLALKHAIRPASTFARLSELKERALAEASVIDDAIAAQALFMRLILAQQAADARHGIKLSARVDVAGLSLREKRELKEAMRKASALVAVTLNLT